MFLFFLAHELAASDDVVIRSGPERASLIELYTSEGCSSCPPAEEWLSGLRKDPGLWRTMVPVAFHVDYWDRLGWKDRFAEPEFTARQQGYAMSGVVSTVYTPGFFVDGNEWREWFGNRKVQGVAGQRAGVIDARLESSGAVSINFTPSGTFENGAAHLVQLGFGLVSDVRRGENAGRALRHDFVALSHTSAKLTRAENHWTARMESPKTSDRPGAVVVWVESGGRPVQAAGGWLGDFRKNQ